MKEDILQKIAISMAKGAHANTVRLLLDRLGGIRPFFELSQSQLVHLSGTNSPIFEDAYRKELLYQAEKEYMFIQEAKIDPFFITDPDYPARLAECDDAPVMLYRLGSCDLDCAHTVGIVGTRHATAYGIDFTRKLVSQLADQLDKLVVVSGLAYGIDVAAHKAALDAGIPTVAVVAHGLNTIYPADHRGVAVNMLAKGGAIVSEYRKGARIHRSNFLERNRIVAGLCDCLVVVESDVRGGAMATARIALNYGREVMAVPGRISDTYSRGTNRLIAANTASLITGADDLMQMMQWKGRAVAADTPPTLFTPLSPEQQTVYDFIKDHPESTANEICVSLAMPFSKLSDHLFQMEMADAIRALPGGRYEIP